MPYPYRKRRYKRRWRKYRRRYPSNLLLSKRITGLARSVRPELKYLDTNATDTDIYTTSGVASLTTIIQGDGVSNRSGQKVRLKSIQIKGILQQDTDTAGVTNLYRLVILIDKKCEAGAPTWTDVFNNENIYSLRDLAVNNVDPKRFKIIWDRTFRTKLDADGTSEEKKHFKFYKKLNHEAEYIQNGGAGGSGGIYILYLGTSATTVTDLSYEARVRFTDVG